MVVRDIGCYHDGVYSSRHCLRCLFFLTQFGMCIRKHLNVTLANGLRFHTSILHSMLKWRRILKGVRFSHNYPSLVEVSQAFTLILNFRVLTFNLPGPQYKYEDWMAGATTFNLGQMHPSSTRVEVYFQTNSTSVINFIIDTPTTIKLFGDLWYVWFHGKSWWR